MFEQQLNAVTLSISHESWDRMVELQKQKFGDGCEVNESIAATSDGH